MTCRRAFEADLPAVLHGERADPDFLAHYPGCPECATEVGVWRELDAMLRTRAPAGDTHPEPETLVAFADAPATLGGAARAEVERHLATCRVCADELKMLAGFDPTRLDPAVPITVAPRPVRSGLARVVWHPAFAYALVAVLLVPIVLDRWPEMETRVTEEEAPAQEKPDRLAEHDVAAQPVPPPPPAVPAPLPAPAKPPPPERSQTEVLREQKLAKHARPADDEAVAARERQTMPRLGMRADADEVRRDDGIAARARRPEAAPPPLARPAPAGALRNESARSEAAQHDAAKGFADAAAPTRMLELRSGTPAVFAPPARGEIVRLRIVPPRDVGAGPVDVAVYPRASGAAILTRRADRADAIAIDIPPNWLLPGDYAVRLSPVTEAASGTRQSAIELRFTVRAPTSAASAP
ncbi:MAG: hypothetical protein IT293_21915 [Deltaproteobacteria bacterium]|nr:hypothetical protein [Deltaproteobacteria bacterium]